MSSTPMFDRFLTSSPTPPPMDLIARYGYTAGMQEPESLQGYQLGKIHREFYELHPVAPGDWGYTEIVPFGQSPLGFSEPLPHTRSDSPLPWMDQIAGGAPVGWGLDGFHIMELTHPLSFADNDWRSQGSPPSTSTTEIEVDEYNLFTPPDMEPPIEVQSQEGLDW
ncbi:hypothetical protein V565_183030, partial [Rhizoctonia solani 123E]